MKSTSKVRLGTNATQTLRVLAITNMFPASDSPHAGRFIQQQIEGLRRIGLEVEVVFIDRLREGMRVYADLPSLISQSMRTFQPDLVHVMYGGIMARIVTQVVTDRPVVVSFHGSDLLGQPFERLGRRLFAALGVMASRQAAKRCSGVVLVAEHLRGSLPVQRRTSAIQVIPCGIDLSLFRPLDRDHCCKELGWRREAFHILFQNTGDPVKRPELAYGALACLKDRLGIDAEIHELRGVKYEHVPVWLNACDTLLVTSFHEGSPTIVKEALACNLPVVSVPVGDVSQRIEGIRGCYLAKPTPGDLAKELHKVFMNRRRIDAEEAIRSLSIDHCARDLANFYVDLLQVHDAPVATRFA